jgi:hypothetical protein
MLAEAVTAQLDAMLGPTATADTLQLREQKEEPNDLLCEVCRLLNSAE